MDRNGKLYKWQKDLLESQKILNLKKRKANNLFIIIVLTLLSLMLYLYFKM